MECCFKGICKEKCSLTQSCDGIRQLIVDLGGNRQFAERYSRYVWFRSLLNKVEDFIRDPTNFKLFGITSKIVAKILLPILKLICRDSFGIEQQLSQIEKQVDLMEQSGFYKEPIEYFNLVGEGYGLIFKYAAVGARTERRTRERIYQLGYYTGTLVSLKDAIIDLSKDKKTGSFNPFIGWKTSKIHSYYKYNADYLISQIHNLTKEKNGAILEPNDALFIGEKKNSLRYLAKYASISYLPFASCEQSSNAHNTVNMAQNMASIQQYCIPEWCNLGSYECCMALTVISVCIGIGIKCCECTRPNRDRSNDLECCSYDDCCSGSSCSGSSSGCSGFSC